MPIRRVRALSWQSDKILGGAVQPHKTVRQESCSLVVALPFMNKKKVFTLNGAQEVAQKKSSRIEIRRGQTKPTWIFSISIPLLIILTHMYWLWRTDWRSKGIEIFPRLRSANGQDRREGVLGFCINSTEAPHLPVTEQSSLLGFKHGYCRIYCLRVSFSAFLWRVGN